MLSAECGIVAKILYFYPSRYFGAEIQAVQGTVSTPTKQQNKARYKQDKAPYLSAFGAEMQAVQGAVSTPTKQHNKARYKQDKARAAFPQGVY